MKDNIFLVGFMASGKTTVGMSVAKNLKRRFVDMDVELEKRFGMPITQVFETEGEEEFRREESRLLANLCRKERLVVATGGGVPEREDNRRLMADAGTVVHLESDLATCTERLSPEEREARPLWKDEERLRQLYQRRKALYAEAAWTVSVDGRSPEAVAGEIVDRLIPDEEVTATLGRDSCPVTVTLHAVERLAELLRGRRVAVLTERTVARLHLPRFRAFLGNAFEIVVSPGELSKTPRSATRVYEKLLKQRFERGDVLVALGGGVVTDLGAFIASTFKRGMGLCLVSTTLVGCVDAAIGGKAAVNLGPAKNIVGCFSVPDGVILDIASLGTLDRRKISEGLVEAYKTGLVRSPELAELVEERSAPLLQGDLPLLAQVVKLSAGAKADVVSRDFREGGLRRILNFGHTYGHAVEGFADFKVSHGQAVAIGMLVATELSRARGLIPEETATRVASTVTAICPIRAALPPVDAAWEIMSHDKKVRQGRVVFVLLEGASNPLCVDDVTREELAAAVSLVEQGRRG
jgi:shikimate kinase / 3-dehydroquinate synthase